MLKVKELSDTIRDELISQNKQQKQLAEYIGIPVTTVSGWIIRGNTPKIDHLLKICEFLNVNLDYLLTGDIQYKNKKNTIEENEMVKLFKKLDIQKQIKALSSVIKI